MSWAIWITGPPGSGKSTIARAAEAELRARGWPVKRLELDEIRESITPAPRYSDAEREVAYRALGYLAELLVETGTPVIVDATAHRRRWRDRVRRAVPRFAEVQLTCPLELCRERERTRPRGHTPADIYAHAGRPGAAVPGVDVPYEPALTPELVVDTSAQDVGESVARIAHLVERLDSVPAAEPGGPGRTEEPGWAIWIAGRPGSGKSTLARCVAERLEAAGARVRVLDLASVQRQLLDDRPAGAYEQDIAHRALAYAAKLLTEAGWSVILDATASRRAWRDAARALIPAFAEIQLRCPLETCLERERAVRWGLTFETPVAGAPAAGLDVTFDYEESADAELTVWTDSSGVDHAVDRVLLVIQRLRAPATARRAG